jgi:hypothetical protein
LSTLQSCAISGTPRYLEVRMTRYEFRDVQAILSSESPDLRTLQNLI